MDDSKETASERGKGMLVRVGSGAGLAAAGGA